ncbi:hypothetical protein [Rossellomorea aquimaris]|uniref:hypothetical protein n=1 Tax=Rossellomorea aquimaris TaxID=189382 RepID=UPI0007D08777|nr:hypothetical protein [Rossellomorea aquimaris]
MEEKIKSDIRNQMKSFCRRNRTALKHTYVGTHTAEEISEMLVERLGLEEVSKMIYDISLIDRRKGNAIFYFIHILEALKDCKTDSHKKEIS